MYRLTIRQLWAHKLRFALTGLAVVLGVAFMTGTTVLTDTMSKTFGDLFTTANAQVDVVVQQPSTVEAEWGDVRDRVPADVLEEIRAIDGVETASGVVQGPTQLVRADGTVAELGGVGVTLGTNWLDPALNPWTVSTGRAPNAADEVVIDVATARDQGWRAGDTVSVLTEEGRHELQLVGTISFGEVDGLPGSTLLATNDATAQALFAEPGTYDRISVSAADGTTPAQLTKAIDAATGDLEVITAEEDTKASQSDFEENLSFMDQFLSAFAYVSLFVGIFIIYNTFSIVVAQRKRDMAMLRAIGASGAQVLRSILLESVLVGVFASAAGLLGGVAMSLGLRALLGAVGLDIPSGDLVVTSETIVTAFVIGLTVTVLSALAPAVRAGRVRPIAALRDTNNDASATSIGRIVAGLTIAGAGAAAFAAGVVGDGSSALQLLGMGAATVIVGVFVLGPVIARPVVAALGWPATKVSGTVGRLARENARRNPRRSAATASALMIGVALVGFITILAASTQQSVSDTIDRTMRADFVVESGSWGQGGLSPELAEAMAEAPGVEAVSPLRSTPAEVDGSSTELTAVDMSTIDQLFDLSVSEGSFPEVGEGELAVKTEVATERGWKLGDTVDVQFPTGATTLQVTALFDQDPVGGEVDQMVDLSTFEEHVSDQFDMRVFVVANDGADSGAVRSALEDIVADHPNAEVQDQTEFKAGITAEIDKMLNLIYGLLALAVIIALIGIANTLALSVHERTREVGLLRAVGMTRGQLRTAIRWESVLIALLGTGLGAILAVAGAWGIVAALESEGVTAFVVPGTQLAVIAIMAAGAGVVAALGPARRASRMDVLAAIATQ